MKNVLRRLIFKDLCRLRDYQLLGDTVRRRKRFVILTLKQRLRCISISGTCFHRDKRC